MTPIKLIRPSAAEAVLETSCLSLRLDTRGELRGMALKNHSAALTLPLDGPALAIDLDAAATRVWVEGWRLQAAAGEDDRWTLPGVDDAAWAAADMLPVGARAFAGQTVHARTRVFLPEAAAAQPVCLVLGGFGLYDFRHLCIWINGQPVGERHTDEFWSPPGHFLIQQGAEGGPLRFGAVNVLAVAARDQVCRTTCLDQLDPRGSRHFPGPDMMAPLFDQYLVVGADTVTAQLRLVEAGERTDGTIGMRLADAALGLTAELTYAAGDGGRTLHRFCELRNTGEAPLRVLDVRHGDYRTGAAVSEGQRGFPVYANDAFWFALAHPSGWVTGQAGEILMQEFPGVAIAPDETAACMESIIGVAPVGQARAEFVAHIRRRSRRVQRGHDRPYAIFENFGSWPLDAEGASWMENREEHCLHSIAQLAAAAAESDCRFDLCSIDFWVDAAGDLRRYDAERFPAGLKHIRQRLAAIGTAPGLWIDSSMGGWTIGGNPAVQNTVVHNLEYVPSYWMGAFMCRAEEPLRSLYRTAFQEHIRADGVRHLKFDNLRSCCSNTHHAHLPGRFSTKAIQDAVIEALQAYDAVCPEVFIFLYWGHRSPWWLLHGDVLFESGLDLEAASPSGTPTLYVRDGVTVGLDQAQWWCRDLPALGKDSLGVWLSHWPWNSCIGGERWQEAFVMDLCRGSLLAQPWSDRAFLDAAQRRQMGEFIALLRAKPECFARPRFILGNPWQGEGYGYCCTDGQSAFLAINNCTWRDAIVPLQLGADWGLPEDQAWDIYRWYPDPVHWRPAGADSAVLARRPFEVALLEVVPPGAGPALPRDFPGRPPQTGFAEPSRELAVTVSEPAAAPVPAAAAEASDEPHACRSLAVEAHLPAVPVPVLVCISVEVFSGDRLLMRRNPGRWFAAAFTLDGAPLAAEPVVRNDGYPTGWQAWRVRLPAHGKARRLCLAAGIVAEAEHELRCRGYAIPQDLNPRSSGTTCARPALADPSASGSPTVPSP